MEDELRREVWRLIELREAERKIVEEKTRDRNAEAAASLVGAVVLKTVIFCVWAAILGWFG